MAKPIPCDVCKKNPETTWLIVCRWTCGFGAFVCTKCGGHARCKKLEQIHVNLHCKFRETKAPDAPPENPEKKT